MTDTIIASLIGVLGGLIGAWIGGKISRKASMEAVESANKNALEIIRRQEFNKAAADFRSAFIPEQRFLSTDTLADKTGTNACDIIKAAIDRHEIAMIRFEPSLCKSQAEAYKKAWKNYAGNSKYFEQYSTALHIDIPEKKKLALSCINELLKFAEYKH